MPYSGSSRKFVVLVLVMYGIMDRDHCQSLDKYIHLAAKRDDVPSLSRFMRHASHTSIGRIPVDDTKE